MHFFSNHFIGRKWDDTSIFMFNDVIVYPSIVADFDFDLVFAYLRYPIDNLFGGVGMRKGYVSYYLFPVYCKPQLLEGMSPELKKRMHGKSCFNFKTVDEALFAELDELTQKGYDDFVADGIIE